MKRLIIFAAALAPLFAKAQDLHFSQVLQSPVLLNPGAVGVYDGWERVVVHHRNQWLGGNTQFMSTAVSADANFLKDPHKNTGYIGVGLSFFNDVGGDAKLGNQVAALSLSGVLPLGTSSQLSLGIQTGFGSRKGDFSKLYYESQWMGAGFNPLLASGEGDNLNSFRYSDVSSGLFYQYDGGKSTFARNNDTKFQAGFAVYHANQPMMRYRLGGYEKLHRKYVTMVNFSRDIPSTSWSFDVQAVHFIQGGHHETIFGGLVRRRFQENTKLTGFSQDASIGFGSYFRWNDALVPTVQIDYAGFRFGLSYDYTVSTMRKAYKGGSAEISVAYTNMHNALFKRRRGR
jgi:type IX secretion system PorP/SprF family membrane protein